MPGTLGAGLKEGYSPLIVFYDEQGRELYGAHVPLQGLKQKNDAYLYTTGTKDGPGAFPYPQEPLQPLFELQAVYVPDLKRERDGEVKLSVWPLARDDAERSKKPVATGKAVIGKKVKAGDYYFAATEVRYWVGMSVRYEPRINVQYAPKISPLMRLRSAS